MKTFVTLMQVIIFSFFVFACSNDNDTGSIENIRITYSNGNLFCEGSYQYHTSLFSKKKYQSGIWKFYHYNSLIKSLIEYDDDGEIINKKRYSEDGKLEYTFSQQDNVEISTYYYKNGNIDYESIDKYDGDNNEWSGSYKLYHKNGQLKEEGNYLDEDWVGIERHWDENGNLILEIEYEDGLIKQ